MDGLGPRVTLGKKTGYESPSAALEAAAMFVRTYKVQANFYVAGEPRLVGKIPPRPELPIGPKATDDGLGTHKQPVVWCARCQREPDLFQILSNGKGGVVAVATCHGATAQEEFDAEQIHGVLDFKIRPWVVFDDAAQRDVSIEVKRLSE